MKTKLSMTVTLMAVAVLVFGVVGTGAWFTDQDTSGNSTLAAGTLSIDVRDNGGSLASGATISNLAPGEWTSWDNLNILNDGTLDAKYRIQSAFVSQSVGGFWQQLNVEAAHGFANGCPASGPAPVVKYSGPLDGFEVNSVDDIDPSFQPLGEGLTHKWCFRFQIDETAGNTYQGAEATFNFVVDATQPSNPGWSQ
jgi:predicted ribosomally synthesized peptide with SipW-like signal peptide